MPTLTSLICLSARKLAKLDAPLDLQKRRKSFQTAGFSSDLLSFRLESTRRKSLYFL